MSFAPPRWDLDGDVFVIVDVVPAGNWRRRENIAATGIGRLSDSGDNFSFLVEGFETESAIGGYGARRSPIDVHDHGQPIGH